MLKNKKCLILMIVLIAIIIAGMVVFVLKGINYSARYGNSVSLQLYIDSDVNMEDIKNISKEVFRNKEIAYANTNKSTKEILITVKEASQEELTLLAEKINEKYEAEITTDDIEAINNYKVKLIDIIEPYKLPVVICLIIILIYFGIMYRKNETLEILTYTIFLPIILQLVYFSVLVLTRIPVGIFTMPISMLIFVFSILGLAYNFNKKYESKEKTKKKSNK